MPEEVYTDREEFLEYFHNAALEAAGRRTMSTVLLGQRRMGKTEIFKRVVNRLFFGQDPGDPDAVVPVYYSFPEAPMDNGDFAAQYLENFIRHYVGFRTARPNLVLDEPDSEELISLAEDAKSVFPFTRTLDLMIRKYKSVLSGRSTLPQKTALETPRTKDDLIRKVAGFVAGQFMISIVTSPMLEIYVDVNDEHDENKSDEEDGFLHFPFCLDVEPAANVDDDAYVGSVGRLLESLRAEGCRAVAACDFEDELSVRELPYANQEMGQRKFSPALATQF